MEAVSPIPALASPRKRNAAKFGMKVFLASEGMLFAGFIAAYIVLRSGASAWPPESAPNFRIHWPPSSFNWLMIINTCLLIASSLTYLRAEAVMRRNKKGLFWLLVTCVLGACFVGIQAYEWFHLHGENMWFGTHGTYSSSFFILTGFHGLHVVIGLFLIVTVFFKSLGRAIHEGLNRGPLPDFTYSQCVGIYWHFVDVVWIFLFLILYVI